MTDLRPEILYLAHRIPYPPDKGDKIRTWRWVEHLAKRFRVHLAAFVDDPRDFAHELFLKSVCESVFLAPLRPPLARVKSAGGFLSGEPLTFAYYRDARMAKHLEEVRARPLAAELAFSSSMAPYLATSCGKPRLLDLCDADSEKWRQYAQERGGPMQWVYAREAEKLAAAETDIINWAETTFAVSPSEAALFSARPNVSRPVLVCGNGVDAEYFSPQASAAGPENAGDVVFTGAMDYAANVDAVTWFIREVWTRVRAEAPKTRFTIVGSNPTDAVKALAAVPGVSVTGKVEDVRPYLQHARVAIAPLRIARGVQNKVLEAMAMGKPVLATSAANAGVGARAGDEILVADDADAFARTVLQVLSDNAMAQRVGDAGRARILNDFRWPERLKALDAALAKVGL